MVRYTKRITPDETNQSYRDGEYINYTFPQNIIDLHSVAKYFTASVDSVEEYNDDTNLKRFLPPNSSAIIDSIQIKRDGEQQHHCLLLTSRHRVHGPIGTAF